MGSVQPGKARNLNDIRAMYRAEDEARERAAKTNFDLDGTAEEIFP
jgi:hypothetical protein